AKVKMLDAVRGPFVKKWWTNVTRPSKKSSIFMQIQTPFLGINKYGSTISGNQANQIAISLESNNGVLMKKATSCGNITRATSSGG
ncbi:MAG: hypothetical protein ACKO9S_02220, partial [Bacteroidota bacterium]